MANVSFTAPGTEFLADQEEIKRRQKMAEILQAQADTPLQTNRMAGGYVVPISPFEGLAKMLQGGMAGYERQTAEQKQKYLTQKASTERQKALADALRLAQGTPESQYEDSMGIGRTQPAQKPDLAAALQRLAGSSDPALQQVGMSGMLQRFVPKEAKWQPTERFNEKTGRAEKVLVNLNDPSQIIPLGGQKAGELHFADNGGTIQGLDKTTGAPVGAPVQKTMSPGETARLDWDKFQWGNASPLQLANLGVDQARLANQGIQTQFDTGRGVGTPMVPRLPQAQMPQIGGTNFAPTQNLGAPANQPAPQVAHQVPVAPQRPPMAPAPQGAPVAAPGGPAGNPALSPKAQQELALAAAKQRQEMEGKRQFNMGGINDALNMAERILRGGQDDAKALPGKAQRNSPTQSGFGTALDWLASQVNIAPKGAAEADQLRSIGGSLVAKMPRMEGPQSDKDVEMYREMAGRIGDSTLPISRRLGALQVVRDLYAKYEGGSTQAPKPTTVLRFDAQGNPVQ